MENNNYTETINIIKAITDDNVIKITEEERKLLRELLLEINIDRNNKILKHIIENDDKLNELIRTINEKLKEHIERKRFVNSYYDRNTIIIDNLNAVKEDINRFKRQQYTETNFQENSIIFKCLSALSQKPTNTPYFFDEFIAIKNNNYSGDYYNLNKDLINKMYDILTNDILVNELKEGTKIINNKNEYENIVGKCEMSLSFKDLVLNNSDSIIEFNKIVQDIDKLLEEKRKEKYIGLPSKIDRLQNIINHLEANYVRKIVNKSRLERLYAEKSILLQKNEELKVIEDQLIKLHIELSKINMKLKDEGVSDLIARSDMKHILNNEEDEFAITSNLRKFRSKEDINNYFSNIENNYVENKDLLEKTLLEEKEFKEYASKEAKDLINNDFETSENISQLSNRNIRTNIDPKIALFVLKSLITAKETKLEEMNITEAEYMTIDDYYRTRINNRLVDFNKAYLEAFDDRKRRKCY